MALMQHRLLEIYDRLYAHFGPQHWWPGETRWEIMVGAVLTQNTSWRNVEKAIENLKHAGRLAPDAMRRTRQDRLARLVRPSGYYNIKARKLKALVAFLDTNYDGDPSRMAGADLAQQRAELLTVYGVGPETADSILLYAAEQPVFVVDAYTRRIFSRLGLCAELVTYHDLQSLFMQHLPEDVALFNEYHALLVALGKNICQKRAPKCLDCPLRDICATGAGRNQDRQLTMEK